MSGGDGTIEVGLLECDHVTDALRHIGGDYADMFRGLLANASPRVELVAYDVIADGVPDDPARHPAWLITGSAQSVFDDDAWIAGLLDFIRDVRAGDQRMVGVCFGHQAIAHALGGRAARSDRGWGVGVQTVEVVAPRPWMQPAQERVRLLMSHQDEVLALPPGATVLAQADCCGISMFELGDRLLGIQGHPEYSTDYAAALLDTRVDRIPPELVTAARASFSEQTDAVIVSDWIASYLAGVS